MPSVIVGQPNASGAQLIISGNPWSGLLVGNLGVQLRFVSAQPGSGICYVALSGFNPPASGNFMTITSGAFPLSGGANSGMLDGMPMFDHDAYYIEPAVLQARTGGVNSGIYNIYVQTDTLGSGGRVFFEPFFGFRGR